MSTEVLARLSKADLHRYRVVDSKVDVAKLMPQAFGVQMIEDLYIRWYELRGEFAETYGLPDDGQWDIALATGVVFRDK